MCGVTKASTRVVTAPFVSRYFRELHRRIKDNVGPDIHSQGFSGAGVLRINGIGMQKADLRGADRVRNTCGLPARWPFVERAQFMTRYGSGPADYHSRTAKFLCTQGTMRSGLTQNLGIP